LAPVAAGALFDYPALSFQLALALHQCHARNLFRQTLASFRRAIRSLVITLLMEERNHMPLPVPDISRNLFDLSGYCSIVTGAGQGIGLALAEALAYAGSDLVLTPHVAALDRLPL
jgi:hypothetical protein